MNTLEISNGIKIENPSSEEIEKYLNSCIQNKYEFIILNRDENSFIQTVPIENDEFILEYKIENNGKHYTSKGNVNIEKVFSAFKGFSKKSSGWRNGIEWEQLNSFDPINLYKKLNIIGYVPLLVFMVMGFLIRFFEYDFSELADKLYLSQLELLYLCLTLGLILKYPYSLHKYKYGNEFLDRYAQLLQFLNIYGTPILTVAMLIYWFNVIAL